MSALAGRRVLVTGAGTGIGRGIALACAQAGADVALHYRDERAGAEATADAIRALGRRAAALPADFRDLAAVEDLADQAERAIGPIDVLVNNAGITATCALADLSDGFFQTLFDVNVRAMLFLTRALAPRMAARGGGVVVNLASLHAFLARRDHVVYAATKGAIVAATRVLAVELAPQRVRVHAIAPGTCVDDPAADGAHLPAGGVSRPDELGRLVVFLAGDDGRHFVGQCLRYDGGWSALFAGVSDFREPAAAPWGERYL